MTDLGSVEQLADTIGNAKLPYLDVVVNNAAIPTPVAMIEDTALNTWNDNMMVAATARS